MCPFDESHSISKKKSSKGGKNENLLLDFIKHLGNVENNWSAEHFQKNSLKSNDFFFSNDFGKKDITFRKFRLFSLIMLAWRLFLEENVDLASRLSI